MTIPAHQIFRRHVEQPLGRRVHTRNDVVGVIQHQRVRELIEDRRQYVCVLPVRREFGHMPLCIPIVWLPGCIGKGG